MKRLVEFVAFVACGFFMLALFSMWMISCAMVAR